MRVSDAREIYEYPMEIRREHQKLCTPFTGVIVAPLRELGAHMAVHQVVSKAAAEKARCKRGEFVTHLLQGGYEGVEPH